MNPERGENYYVNVKPKLMKGFDKSSKGIVNVLKQHFDESKTEQLLMKTRDKYESLIPQLPYIGGKSNIHNFNLIGSAWMLALIRTLEEERWNVREIGKILYDLFEAYFESMPRIKKWLAKRMFSSKILLKRYSQHAKKSQLRTYPDDWVFEFVEGDGETFDYGFNYTECAICKFYKKQDAERYIPYLCLGDYSMFRAFGVGMKRTQTIGNGAEFCDFRFKKNGVTRKGWPPENLEEFKGDKR